MDQHRAMAWTGGFLYLSGGLLVLLTVLVPSWEMYAAGWVAGVGALGSVVGIFYLWSAERLAMPAWTYVVATSLGAVLVTVAAVGGGPETTATYGVLYVFVTSYGFYWYPWPVATWLIVLSGIGYGVVLAWHDVPAALVHWAVLLAATVIAGGMIGSLGRRMRQLLAQEQAQLRKLSELDEWKTTFLRAAAHDLRSPLAAMLGLLGLVRDHEEELDPDRRRDLLVQSIGTGQRLQQLLDDLLDLERLEAGDIQPRLEPTEVAELVRSTVEEVSLDRRMTLDLVPVMAQVEPGKLERIVSNLVGNALRHTPADAQVWVRLRDEQGAVVILVEDDGPGLPAAIREDPFGAFHSGKATGSTGLGLHIAHRFVELHGGTLGVSERDGGGTSFEVRLPREHVDS